MKERPILFSGPMVRAILDGTKTQTRRVITTKTNAFLCYPAHRWTVRGSRLGGFVAVDVPDCKDSTLFEHVGFKCPYGQPGDLLWVRETWAPHGESDLSYKDRSGIYYRADDETNYTTDGAWRPSIHMPRWASRITLRITGVRVERVQDISEEDAQAEGVSAVHLADLGQTWKTRREGFHLLWDSINAKRGYGWDVNPWVWVIEFRVKR